MPVTLPPASDAARKALQDGLADFVDPTDTLSGTLRLAPQGVKVAILSLQDALSGSGLENAREIGWGFFAGTANGPAIAAQVNLPEAGKPAVLTSFSHGAEITFLIQSINKLQGLPEVQAGDYELWILRIPAILLETFWLKSRSGGPDLIVPFHTRSRKIQTMRPYSPDEFLEVAQSVGQTFRGFDYYRGSRDPNNPGSVR